MTHPLIRLCLLTVTLLAAAHASPDAGSLRLKASEFSLSVPPSGAQALSLRFDPSASEQKTPPELPPTDVYLSDEALSEVLTTHARHTLGLELRVGMRRDGAGRGRLEVQGVIFLDEQRPIAAGQARLNLEIRLGRPRGPTLSPALLERLQALARGCWVSSVSDYRRARLNGALILALNEGPEGRAARARVVVDGLVHPKLTRCLLKGLKADAQAKPQQARSAPLNPPTLLPLYLHARPAAD